MRLSRADFRTACKSFFRLEFASQDITAFGGLELIRRYFGLIKLSRSVRSVFARYDLGGDYRAIDMILVIIVLILVGGRRLDHLNYLCEDPFGEAVLWFGAFAAASQRGPLVEALYAQVACGFGGNQQSDRL